jgi:hypothetical protein
LGTSNEAVDPQDNTNIIIVIEGRVLAIRAPSVASGGASNG